MMFALVGRFQQSEKELLPVGMNDALFVIS